MKTIQALVVVAVLLILAVAFHNWPAVTQAIPVDVYVTTVNMSLALVLLVALCVVALLHVATVGRIRMQAAVESRELHRELERARREASTAEASRLAEMRTYLEREIPEIEVKLDLVLERLGVAEIARDRSRFPSPSGEA